MNATRYSSKLLLNGQYGICINDKLVATTTSRDRFHSIMRGLQQKAARGQTSPKPEEVA